MYSFVVLCFFFFVSFVFSQTPSTPVWPSQFSTDVEHIRSHPPRVDHFKWNYDKSLNADRFDRVLGEPSLNVSEIEINDYKTKTRYMIQSNPSGMICKYYTLNHDELPVRNFTTYEYKGKEDIRGETTDHWELSKIGSRFSYFDDATTFVPVRYAIETPGNHLEAFHYSHFVKGAQNPSLFDVKKSFPTLQCTQGEGDGRKTDLEHPSLDAESCAEMQNIVRAYFPSEYQNDMICIAFYESSYRCDVYNGICCYGLFQINRNHLGESGCPSTVTDLDECDPNAKCARHVLDTQGIDAWQTWTEGDCRSWSGCKV